MPTYEFVCIVCDKTENINCKYEEIDSVICSSCNYVMKRSFKFGSVAFRGSGFYSTDK
jgi:putative FmdB family regulatory protein